jgi:hypothetical protein
MGTCRFNVSVMLSRGRFEVLLSVAAIVGGIAVLVGALIAAPLWFGFDIDAGLIVNALAAFGSVGAAIAALYIATGDRRERTRERAAAAEAQARLVILNITSSTGQLGWDAAVYSVGCVNHGNTPILEVRLESAHMRGFPQAKPKLSDAVTRVLPPAPGHSASFATTWVDENDQPFPQEKKQQHVNTVDIEAAVSFFDANGSHWLRSNTGTLRRL